jgi:small subunit ribosomal protein S18
MEKREVTRELDDYSAEREGGEERPRRLGGFRKKQCRPSLDPDFVVDYKNVDVLKNYLTEHGKIIPRRVSGNSALVQRKLTEAIKRARQLALIGYVSRD